MRLGRTSFVAFALLSAHAVTVSGVWAQDGADERETADNREPAKQQDDRGVASDEGEGRASETLPPGASEDTSRSAERERISELFWEATDAYTAGEYERAIVLFERYHSESGHNAALFNIAQCHRKLGRCEEARAVYDRYVALEQNIAEQVATWLDTLDEECSTTPFEPDPEEPAAAERRPSFDTEGGGSSMRGADALDLPLRLEQQRTAGTVDAGTPSSRAVWGWSLVGGSVVAAGASALYAWRWKSTHDDARGLADELAKTQSDEPWDERGAGYEEEMDREQSLSIGFGAASAVLMAAGLGVLLFADSSTALNPAEHALHIGVSEGGANASWRGTF